MLLAAVAPCAKAQQSIHRGAHFSHRTHRSSPLTSLLAPFFGDSFNPEDLASAGDPTQAPPFLLPATRALSGPAGFEGPPENTHENSSQPLLIELQGDRYVRVSGTPADGEARPLTLAAGPLAPTRSQSLKSARNPLPKPLAPNSVTSSALAAASPAGDLPPAILIFRDGHSEEVRDYTIADGFLYARGDYYHDGYWNKKIDLSALNLAATMQTNATRNVKFALPSSPNEVITRP
jgi:hypothetical protein